MWIESVAACTLPTADRPLRAAEFDTLFAGYLKAIDRRTPTRLRLELDIAAAATARDLAARESACCSFFTFDFMPGTAATVWMQIDVPPAHVDVLDGLSAHAAAASAR